MVLHIVKWFHIFFVAVDMLIEHGSEFQKILKKVCITKCVLEVHVERHRDSSDV